MKSRVARLELVIDGVVHYDKIHTVLVMPRVIEKIKSYLVRVGYKQSFELSTYHWSKITPIRPEKISFKEQGHAIELLQRYPLRHVARRYNVDKATILRYKLKHQNGH